MKIKPKKFTGRENHSITILEAIDFIKNYRAYPNLGRNTSCFFDRHAIETLIEQPGAVGLRYYCGLTDDNRKVLVLVGTNAERQDLIDGAPLQLSVFNPAFDDNGEYAPAQIDHGIALEDAARLTAAYRDLERENLPSKGDRLALVQSGNQRDVKIPAGQQNKATNSYGLPSNSSIQASITATTPARFCNTSES